MWLQKMNKYDTVLDTGERKKYDNIPDLQISLSNKKRE